MITWHLETRRINDLKPHKSNPRRMTKEQKASLQTSLDKFGLIDKPIINTSGLIIGGHQRIRILKDQGIKEIECTVPDKELSEQEVDELLIRLNKNTGEWNFDELANNFDVVDLFEWGFTADELHVDEGKEEKEKKEKECPHCGGKL